MKCRNLYGVCIAFVGLLTVSAPVCRAQIEEETVFLLGKEIVKAAHPTGVKHELKDHSSRGNKLTIEMDWKGGLLGTPYTSTIKVEFESVGGKTKIKSIDYKDDAVIAYNRGNIDRLIRKLNDD